MKSLLGILRAASPATKISLTLVFLSTSILLAASAIGVVPDHDKEVADLRRRITESLGMSLWMTARHGDPDALAALTESILDRHPDILSIGIETHDGRIAFETPDHARLWPNNEAAGPIDRLTLPLLEGESAWGSVQICCRPLSAGPFNTATRLTLFMSLLGFIVYRTYLRKILRYLDPSSVIPERVKTMLDTMSEGVLVLDERERVLLANSAFEQFSGLDNDHLQGRKASLLLWRAGDPEQDEPTLPWTMTAEDGVESTSTTLRLESSDGTERTFVVNATPIHGGDGVKRGVLATFDDVSDIERKNERLEQMVRELKTVRQQVESQNDELRHIASRDAPTGCLNRRALFEQFENEWNTSQRYGHGVACIMLDLDMFKSINDNHGHTVGDQVLQRTVAVLERETRTSDVVGRYGGEEFCIIVSHADVAMAAIVGEKVRSAIEAEPMAGLTVTASIGVSAQELGASSPQNLIDEADRALYAAKNGGRNRVVRWDEMPEETSPVDPTAASAIPTPETHNVAIPYHAVTALMSALAQRDDSTAAHSRRVADLCMVIAKDLMPAGDAFILEIAALLHDIGKIGVPDAVLLKPGKLTPDEWEIMEKHDQIGIEIINSAFHCTELTAIVRNHHANFNGDARDPALPAGHDIPLRARILSIADAYDAMVSDRVYRKGRPPEEAFIELRRCAGTQFDPDLVERFIDALTAHGAGRAADRPGESLEVMLRLGLATERLAAAIESSDVTALAALADRLSDVATTHKWTQIAELAGELSGTMAAEGELEDLLATTRELVNLCQSTQSDFLAEQRTKAATRDRNAA